MVLLLFLIWVYSSFSCKWIKSPNSFCIFSFLINRVVVVNITVIIFIILLFISLRTFKQFMLPQLNLVGIKHKWIRSLYENETWTRPTSLPSTECQLYLSKFSHVLGASISSQNQPLIKGYRGKGKRNGWPFLTKEGSVMCFQWVK